MVNLGQSIYINVRHADINQTKNSYQSSTSASDEGKKERDDRGGENYVNSFWKKKERERKRGGSALPLSVSVASKSFGWPSLQGTELS